MVHSGEFASVGKRSLALIWVWFISMNMFHAGFLAFYTLMVSCGISICTGCITFMFAFSGYQVNHSVFVFFFFFFSSLFHRYCKSEWLVYNRRLYVNEETSHVRSNGRHRPSLLRIQVHSYRKSHVRNLQ